MRVTWKKPRLAEGPVPLRPKPSSSEQSLLCSRYVSRNRYWVIPLITYCPPRSSRSPKSYDDPSAPSRVDGEPTALTVIEENDSQPARNLGGIFSPKNAHSLYSQESPAVSEYSHAHLMAPNLRPQPNEYRQPGVSATAHHLQAHVYNPNLQQYGYLNSLFSSLYLVGRLKRRRLHFPPLTNITVVWAVPILCQWPRLNRKHLILYKLLHWRKLLAQI